VISLQSLGLGGLVGAYVLIAVLLLGLVVYSNWPWQVKSGAILVTSLFYIVTYLSLPPLFGWPAYDTPPERFRLIYSYVEPPDKQSGFKGSVYLWLSAIDELSAPAAPRAYRLEYTESLHQLLLNTNSKLNRGIPQLGEYRNNGESDNIQFYDLPDPMFPDK
jgi:hypothetical protein